MSVVASPVDVNAMVPDGIEPVEAFRCWTFTGGKLQSLNGGGVGETWQPGEHLTAKCNATPETYRWNVVRYGMTTAEAAQRAAHLNDERVNSYGLWRPGGVRPMWFPPRCPTPPTAVLPDGYGYELVTKTHDAPHESCTCGIYAADAQAGVPDSGNVYGKVKLWGKVVPGEKGYRAQYAYPSEFRVAPGLENDAALLAFGVPIVTDATLSDRAAGGLNNPFSAPPTVSRRNGWMYRAAIGMNVAACLLNLGLLAMRSL